MSRAVFTDGPLEGECWHFPLDEPPERVFENSDLVETFVYHRVGYSNNYQAWLYELFTSYHYEVPI